MIPSSRKSELLKAMGALNPHPERVKAPGFREDSFFDPRDLVQVRYEMLRHAQQEGATKSTAAARFGVSRPTFYHLEAAFLHEGLSGLLPRPRGPKAGHKLTGEVMACLDAARHVNPKAGARQLARRLQEEHGVSVHPRSIERALARKKKTALVVPRLPPEQLNAYEALRTAVVQGTAPPQALSAVVREGMLRGLDRESHAPTTAPVIAPGVPCLSPTLAAPAWIGVLANIVLCIRAEARHGY